MADNRKYYYLKLKEDFFDTDEMKILESMKDGYLYSNILLKLYLKSLSNSGRLMYRNVIPYTPEILATLTGHQVGTVEKALDVFKKYEIIGKKKEELVPMLKSLRATGGTAYNDMIAVLDATVEAVNKSGVFSEVGKSGHGSVHVSDAEGKIEGIAKSYMQKEPSMSYTDALAKAWEDNPDLMDAYDAEEGF